MAGGMGRWLGGGLLATWMVGGAAATYTVGPGGSHATVQAAIDAAQATTADDEIRLRGIDLVGGLNLVMSPTTGSLSISGGWNSDFTTVVGSGLDPSNGTAINANLMGTNLRVLADAGVLELQRMRLIFGSGVGVDVGGNLSARLQGTAQLRLTDVHFRQGAATHAGAGAYVSAAGNSRWEATDCTFQNNRITAASGSYFGAGLSATAADSATVSLTRLAISGGEGLGGVAGYGSGLDILARNESVVDVIDSVVTSNSSTASGDASAVSVAAFNSALVNLERILVQANSATATTSYQIVLDRRDLSVIFVNDSVISDSSSSAFLAIAFAGFGGIVMNNVTMARNAGPGQVLDLGGSLVSVNNSILHDNGSTILTVNGANNLGANLGLAAPIFAGDYRLAAGSPGIDQGTAAVPRGLGSFDIDLNPRVMGSSVDIGAAEFIPDTLFQSGFE